MFVEVGTLLRHSVHVFIGDKNRLVCFTNLTSAGSIDNQTGRQPWLCGAYGFGLPEQHKAHTITERTEGCIVWNAHNTVFGSKRRLSVRLSKWAWPNYGIR